MIVFLGVSFLNITFISLFHFVLAVIIIMFENFSIIWNASIIFCIMPNTILIIIYSLSYTFEKVNSRYYNTFQ